MPLVSAPTGQMSMQAPHSSHSRWSPWLGAISETTPRLITPSAPTPMPSLQMRTQRKHRMQRGASKNTTGENCFSGVWTFSSL